MSKRKQKNKNALKHGAFATEFILWGETSEEYEALRAAIYEEWGPSGKTEEFEADKLVKLSSGGSGWSAMSRSIRISTLNEFVSRT